MQTKPYKSDIIDNTIIDLIIAGLDKDSSKTELAALSLSRHLRKEFLDFSIRINEIIGAHSNGAVNSVRGKSPIPIDADSHLEMATIIRPETDKDIKPILNKLLEERVQGFLNERNNLSVLLNNGIKPSNSLLLIGNPGTGKTMLAKYIATALNKEMAVLDLSTSISSLLGKTGSNLKRVLNYAKNTGSILLLDEFDAIAKRRDDLTDLGEIKRVVNVLLMELEDWPVSSIVIATSNHPELLDRAIWRRFDHIFEIGSPESNERIELLTKELIDFLPNSPKTTRIIELLNDFLIGKSANDICKYANNVKRRIILKNEDFVSACLTELSIHLDKKMKGKLCNASKEKLNITVRDLAEITGLSSSGVQHHLKKNNINE